MAWLSNDEPCHLLIVTDPKMGSRQVHMRRKSLKEVVFYNIAMCEKLSIIARNNSVRLFGGF